MSEKTNLKTWLETRWHGTLMAVIIGAASLFVSEHYGGPAVLFALLIGMAFHFLSEDKRTLAGINFSSTTILRWGVGLLGAKITADQLGLLSPALLCMIVGGVFATLLFGCVNHSLFQVADYRRHLSGCRYRDLRRFRRDCAFGDAG